MYTGPEGPAPRKGNMTTDPFTIGALIVSALLLSFGLTCALFSLFKIMQDRRS
jgi:hypothetical protein